MRLVLDKPTPIEELRKVYNDKVTFITSVKNYPLVKEIEFHGDYNSALNKRKVPVRVSRLVDRAINRYDRDLKNTWDQHTSKIKALLRITDPKQRQQKAQQELTQLNRSLKSNSRPAFEEVYKLGKIRGQVLSGQELDDELTGDDRRILNDREKWNDDYLNGLTDDLWAEIEEITGKKYDDPQDVINALDELDKIQEKQKRRLPLFAAAIGSVILGAGTVATSREPEEGLIGDAEDFPPLEEIKGGFWNTKHDNRVCPGCEENDGKWMTVDQFQEEVGTNQCLTRCRCAELFEITERPLAEGQIWQGTPGSSIARWPRFKRVSHSGDIQKRRKSHVLKKLHPILQEINRLLASHDSSLRGSDGN